MLRPSGTQHFSCDFRSFSQFLVVFVDRWHDPNFQFCFDILVELDLTGVCKDQVPSGRLRGESDPVSGECLQRSNNLRSTNTAVEVSFFVGVGFDGNALLGNVLGEIAQVLYIALAAFTLLVISFGIYIFSCCYFLASAGCTSSSLQSAVLA